MLHNDKHVFLSIVPHFQSEAQYLAIITVIAQPERKWWQGIVLHSGSGDSGHL